MKFAQSGKFESNTEKKPVLGHIEFPSLHQHSIFYTRKRENQVPLSGGICFAFTISPILLSKYSFLF